METNKITVGQIIKDLNKLIEPLNGQRIDGFAEFHNKVKELIQPYLDNLDLEHSAWSVDMKKPIEHYMAIRDEFGELKKELRHLFVYEIPQFKDDKRNKFRRCGRLNKVVFTTNIEADPETSLNDYIYQVHIKYNEYRLKNLEKRRQEIWDQFNSNMQDNIAATDHVLKRLATYQSKIEKI